MTELERFLVQLGLEVVYSRVQGLELGLELGLEG